MQDQALERCDNCLKEFPESKIATHFGYCRRNIKKCSECGEMYDINFQEEHEEEYHRMEDCPHCKASFNANVLPQHQKKCPQKPKFCEYCELNVPVTGFAAHFAACEARTKPCSKCNRPVMNKDYLVHLVSCTGPPPPEPVQPQPKSYMEHITHQTNVMRSRQEPVPAPQVRPSREKVSNNVRQEKEKEKPYAQISRHQPKADTRVYYEPRVVHPSSRPSQQQPIQSSGIRQPEAKVEYNAGKYGLSSQASRPSQGTKPTVSYPRREETKPTVSYGRREEHKPTVSYVRKEEQKPAVTHVRREEPKPVVGVRQYGGIGAMEKKESTNTRPSIGSSQNGVKRLASREVKQPVSNKDIFGGVKNGGLREKKPEQRQQMPSYTYKREEERHKVATSKYQLPSRTTEQQRIQPSQPVAPVRSNPRPNPGRQNEIPAEYYQQHFSSELGMSPEQQQMQEAIMMSMGGVKPAKHSTGSHAPRQQIEDLPFIEGQDLDESFIAKQRAIEEEFARRRR